VTAWKIVPRYLTTYHSRVRCCQCNTLSLARKPLSATLLIEVNCFEELSTILWTYHGASQASWPPMPPHQHAIRPKKLSCSIFFCTFSALRTVPLAGPWSFLWILKGQAGCKVMKLVLPFSGTIWTIVYTVSIGRFFLYAFLDSHLTRYPCTGRNECTMLVCFTDQQMLTHSFVFGSPKANVKHLHMIKTCIPNMSNHIDTCQKYVQGL